MERHALHRESVVGSLMTQDQDKVANTPCNVQLLLNADTAELQDRGCLGAPKNPNYNGTQQLVREGQNQASVCVCVVDR